MTRWRMIPDDGWWHGTYTKYSSNEWHLALVFLLFLCTCPNWCYSFDLLSFLDSLALRMVSSPFSAYFCAELWRPLDVECQLSFPRSPSGDMTTFGMRWIGRLKRLQCLWSAGAAKHSSWEHICNKNTFANSNSIRLQKGREKQKETSSDARHFAVILRRSASSVPPRHQTRIICRGLRSDFQDLRIWCLLVWRISFKYSIRLEWIMLIRLITIILTMHSQQSQFIIWVYLVWLMFGSCMFDAACDMILLYRPFQSFSDLFFGRVLE